jgi:hypothetical protein
MSDAALRKFTRISLWGSVGTFLLSVLAYVRPEAIAALLEIVGLYALIISTFVALGLGVTQWRRKTRLWIIPTLICTGGALAVYFLAAPMGRILSDWEFRRHVEEYQSVVDAFQSGSLSCPVDCTSRLVPMHVSQKLPARIVLILVGRCNGGSVVAFLVGTDVPTLHEGYVFRGYAGDTPCINGSIRIGRVWPYVRHVTGDWYRFADHPGF